MKITKNVFICALLVLMLLLCINTCSAKETLDESFGADCIDELAVVDAPVDELSANGDTIGVNANGNEDFTTISDAGSVAAGEETIILPEGTIYVSETGNDENGGLSEENAIATLSHAVDIVKARENKTATVYVINGDYITPAIDISDDIGVSLSIIGQEKGGVTIQGTGAYIFDVYGDNLVWNFKNLDFVGIDSTARTSAALVLYSKNGNFTVDNCNFRNINSRLGAIAIGNDNGNTEVTNCIIEDITGSSSSTSILTVNGDGTFVLDNITIKNCRLDESVASSNDASYLRTIIYVNTYEADLTIINSEISGNVGPAMSLIECRSKLTIVNTTISDNVVNTSLSGNNGGDNLIWANNDNSNINIAQCVIENNTIVKSGKGLFYNQKGSINVEYSAIIENDVDNFVGSTGTITANNNWWGINDQPDSKVDSWVIMNVEVDDSDLTENNEITLTIDFNHVKTSSGTIEELTGGEIPKDSYIITVSAQNGNVTPESLLVQKGEVKSQLFTVTNVNDVITLTCDGGNVEIVIEGVKPYRGIIYVNKTGDDNNEGSIDAPVATLTKAIELANDGIGQIVIDEGIYTGYGYQVTKGLNITGVGNVTLDADGQGGLFITGYPTNATKFILTNLTLTGANADYGQAINSYATELVLNNVNITDNPGSGSLIIQSGKLTINDCIIANHNGGNVISDSSSAQIIINNTLFENNTVTDYAIGYFSGYSGDLIIENTQFINNTGRLGILKTNKRVTVKDSKFIDNTNTNSYGGAISDCDSFSITNSTFINNKAAKDGGAISVGYNRVATITKSTFINNTANTEQDDFHGDAIYNNGKLTVNYCVLLTNAENSLIYSDSKYDANLQYNWWGTNHDPSSLNGVGTYEDDDYEEVESVIDSSNWVYMNVTTNLTDDNVTVGDKVGITVDFTNYIDSTNALRPLSDSIPEVEVSASSINGNLDAQTKETSSNVAQFTYTALNEGQDTITIKSSNAIVPITINGNGGDGSIIYVDADNGADTNDGKTRQTAVKTIAHALEIHSGQIVLLEGTHKVDDLGSIYEDVNITGEGNAIIDAQNNNRILYVGSEGNVVITNVVMINGYSIDESGALLGNANCLTLINCTLANSTAGQNYGGAIYSVGKLTLINTTVANCSAREGGAIWTNNVLSTGNSIVLMNSKFINNSASGNDNLGGGAIFAQQITEFIIDNTSFIDNKAGTTSSGGAIFISHSSATVTISNSEFISNHASGQDGTGGGAIYRTGTSNYQRDGNMIITGTLFENNTCDANGGAIYVRATTLSVASSVLINNTDANGLAVYGYKTEQVSPAVTLNDNWWGSNDSPKDFVGGNRNYKPTLNRWAILTVANDTEIIEGSTVRLTISINNYTTGLGNGTLSTPISVPRTLSINSTYNTVNYTLSNGEFIIDYYIEPGLKYLAVNVDEETVVLRLVSSSVRVEVGDITAKKYDKVNVVINVTSNVNVDSGKVDLYAGTTLIDTIYVHNGKAIKDIVIPNDLGTYELIARFSDDSGFFEANESNATLTVDGICELWNDTFFNFFDENGILEEAINEDELVFHGEFGGLGVNIITINKPMTIRGDEAVLYDMAYKLACDDIVLTDISLIEDCADFTLNYGAAVYANGVNIVLDNVSVEYNAPSDKEAFAIFADTADEFKLINSEIRYTANNHDYSKTIHQYAVHVAESSDVLIANNIIVGTLPALDVAYTYLHPELIGIYQDLVAIIAVQSGNNININGNIINATTDGGYGLYPTISSVLVNGADELLVNYNNITHIDLTSEDVARYYYTVDLYNSNLTVEFNNILLNTTSGINRQGSAYPIQLTGPINGLINKNNLTSVSKGPNLGIFVSDWDGDVVVTITDNLINITGYSTENNTALVSGMELQAEFAYVYNNTIYTYNIGEYDDINYIYGISYAQWYYGDHSLDIRENTVFTEGKFAVFILNGVNSNVTDNILYAHELFGDESVNISSGSGNIIENNYPVKVNISVVASPAVYGENVIVNVTGSAAGDYTVSVNGVTKNITVSDAGEFVSVDFDALPVNTQGYSIIATYNATLKYIGAVNDTEVVVVNRATPTISVSADSIKYGEDLVVNVEVSGDVTRRAIVTIGNESKFVSLTNGSGSVKVSGLNAGDYTVIASYNGDANYAKSSANITVNVKRGDVSIKVSASSIHYGEDLVVNVKLSDDVSRRAVVTIGNETKLASLTNGSGSVRFSGLAVGNHTIVVSYNGDANYGKSVSVNKTVKVYKGTANIKVTASPVSYGENAVITIELANASRRINVTVGNESKLVSLTNGIGIVEFSGLAVGTHNITVTYKGDDNYSPTTVNATVKVDRAIPEIQVTADNITYGEALTVNVQLPSDVSRRATVTIGNQSRAVTLKNGTGSVKFTGLEVGTHEIQVSYAGDANYKATSAATAIEVKN